MNSSTFLCSLGLLMVAGYASAGGVIKEMTEDLGRCPGPNVCVECRKTRERICVPPLANEALIRQYCERKDKVHCIRPMNNNYPYLESEEKIESARLPSSHFVNVHGPNDRALAVVENVQGSCPFLFFCKSCPNGTKVCCPSDIALSTLCCYGPTISNC